MDLRNPLKIVMHYLLIGEMIGLGYYDVFHMVSALSVYGYTLNRSYGESWCKVIR